MSWFSLAAPTSTVEPERDIRARQSTNRSEMAFHVVRVVVAAVLLVAAGLKGHQLATAPVPESGLLTSRWFLIAAVEIELLCHGAPKQGH